MMNERPEVRPGRGRASILRVGAVWIGLAAVAGFETGSRTANAQIFLDEPGVVIVERAAPVYVVESTIPAGELVYVETRRPAFRPLRAIADFFTPTPYYRVGDVVYAAPRVRAERSVTVLRPAPMISAPVIEETVIVCDDWGSSERIVHDAPGRIVERGTGDGNPVIEDYPIDSRPIDSEIVEDESDLAPISPSNRSGSSSTRDSGNDEPILRSKPLDPGAPPAAQPNANATSKTMESRPPSPAPAPAAAPAPRSDSGSGSGSAPSRNAAPAAAPAPAPIPSSTDIPRSESPPPPEPEVRPGIEDIIPPIEEAAPNPTTTPTEPAEEPLDVLPELPPPTSAGDALVPRLDSPLDEPDGRARAAGARTKTDPETRPAASDRDDDWVVSRRESLRPAAPYTIRREAILQGRVLRDSDRQAEGDVRVTFKDPEGKLDPITATSDALGRFAVRVPDGVWKITAQAENGDELNYGEIVVKDTVIEDRAGRRFSSVTLRR